MTGVEDPEEIAATVAILTYNSMEVLPATLLSAWAFAEVLICDGGSTDGTRDLCHALGCRIIDQGDEYTDDLGRLINMTGVREQMAAAAGYPWVFVLDHDEIATPELLAEIREIVSGDVEHGGYEVPRKYVMHGSVVECATTYPSYQTRLVNRDSLAGYEGIIHDHPVFRDGVSVGRLTQPMLIPQPPLRELWRKWVGYMRLEEVGKLDLDRRAWVDEVVRPEARRVRWLLYRTVKIRRTCESTRLPLSYELSRIVYELGVVWYTGRRFAGFRPGSAREAWR